MLHLVDVVHSGPERRRHLLEVQTVFDEQRERKRVARREARLQALQQRSRLERLMREGRAIRGGIGRSAELIEELGGVPLPRWRFAMGSARRSRSGVADRRAQVSLCVLHFLRIEGALLMPAQERGHHVLRDIFGVERRFRDLLRESLDQSSVVLEEAVDAPSQGRGMLTLALLACQGRPAVPSTKRAVQRDSTTKLPQDAMPRLRQRFSARQRLASCPRRVTS